MQVAQATLQQRKGLVQMLVISDQGLLLRCLKRQCRYYCPLCQAEGGLLLFAVCAMCGPLHKGKDLRSVSTRFPPIPRRLEHALEVRASLRLHN